MLWHFLNQFGLFLGVLLKLFIQLIAAGKFIKVGLIIMAVSVLLWFLGGLI